MAIYLLHIEFVDDDDDKREFGERLRESGTLLKERLRDLTIGDPERLYSTTDGRIVGLWFQTERPAGLILRHIDAPGSSMDGVWPPREDDRPDTAVFRRFDRVWLLELGERFEQQGFRNPARWLERHGMSQGD